MNKLVCFFLLFLFSLNINATNVKLLVEVPDNTPSNASLSLGGDFNSWNPTNRAYQLTKLSNGSFEFVFKEVKAGTVLNFKVTRGNWDTVEISADGSNRDNRAYLVTEQDQSIRIVVEDWADLSNKEAPSTIVGEVIFKKVELPTFSGERYLRIYLPADYYTTNKRYPVIYMTDAQNLYDKKTANAGEWQMDELMEQLHENNSPLTSIIVGIDHAGSDRGMEYLPFKTGFFSPSGKGDKFADWLALTLKPEIDKEFRTKPGREDTTMMGSSMGGLITCYTVLKHQAIFSKAACLSSAFLKRLVSEHWLEYIGQNKKHFNTRFHMDMGDNEFGLFGDDILTETQEVYEQYLKSGFTKSEVRNLVIKGGTHDEPSWRNRTLDILTWLNSGD